MSAQVVQVALPRDVHQNHKALFMLARAVKAIECRLGREFSEDKLRATFEKWYSANGFLCPGRSKDEYWFEFLEAYENVKYPFGEGVLTMAWAEVQKRPLPPKAPDDYRRYRRQRMDISRHDDSQGALPISS